MLAVLAFFCGSLHAVTLTAPPQVSAGTDSATVVWKTNVECGSRLNYGRTPDALTQRGDGKVSAHHSVTIGGLEPGTTYYYAVGSARQRLATGSFTTSTTSAPAAVPQAAAPEKPAPGLLPRLLSTIGIGDSKPVPPPAAKQSPPQRSPPTRATWANLPSLQDHYERHGRDFNATSPDDYAAKAWLFREQARAASWPMKLDTDGTIRMWDGRTGSFAAYNRDGTTKTFFKPGSPSYWQRQPGRPITPAQLPFK
jgi:Purple acid Phosphatase, N-terminal domain